MKIILVVVSIASLLTPVKGRSAGAPSEACPAVAPQHGSTPQNSASPFSLTVQGNPTEYVPGQQYQLTFSRGGSAFLGFLIIGRNMNGQNVGSFSAASGQRTACSDNRGITHSDAGSKTSITLTWTAPSAGTGPVTFRYAGVDSYNTYWVNQMGPQLNEQTVAPMTTSSDSTTSAAVVPSTTTTSSDVMSTPGLVMSTSTSSSASVTPTPSPAATSPPPTVEESPTSHGMAVVANGVMMVGTLIYGLLMMLVMVVMV